MSFERSPISARKQLLYHFQGRRLRRHWAWGTATRGGAGRFLPRQEQDSRAQRELFASDAHLLIGHDDQAARQPVRSWSARNRRSTWRTASGCWSARRSRRIPGYVSGG